MLPGASLLRQALTRVVAGVDALQPLVVAGVLLQALTRFSRFSRPML